MYVTGTFTAAVVPTVTALPLLTVTAEKTRSGEVVADAAGASRPARARAPETAFAVGELSHVFPHIRNGPLGVALLIKGPLCG
ncbi:hypothetical protein [Streptomyces sviceus]|uniref:hypothetical protein n=1 Tax=Streptomyces TaxID=1883 RepID=UPI001FD8028E|nr:hypothetical protein [Streptomyces sviceus]